jgi:hypothetical protein
MRMKESIGKDLGPRETGNMSETIVYYFEYWYSLELGYCLGASLNLFEVGVD